MAERIHQYMKEGHTKFIYKSVPTCLEKPDPNGRIKVTWQSSDDPTATQSDEFDTVLFAIGRYAVTEGVELQNAGVEV